MTVHIQQPDSTETSTDGTRHSFPLERWYVAALSKEVKSDPVGKTLLNEPLVIFRTEDGQVHALEDRCCHRFLPLSSGSVEAGGLRCGYHGLLFNGDGKCIEIPGQDKIPSRAKIHRYVVKEQDEIVWIWFGSEATSEPASEPPRYQIHSDSGFYFDGDVYHYQAPYQLVHDNLLDLSHLGYVHLKTIGGNAKIHMNAPMEVTQEGESVKVVRHMLNSAPPPTYSAAYPFGESIDRWQEIVFYPSHLEIWTGAVNHNTDSVRDPDRGGFHMRGFHGLTPETEESCYYFWTIASNPSSNIEAVMEKIVNQTKYTFDEDKEVIEAQYKNMKRFPGKKTIDIHVDVAPNRARRIVESLKQSQTVGPV